MQIFLAFGLAPPLPYEIGYYRGDFQAARSFARAFYNFSMIIPIDRFN
jgi:hypothetical protein